VFILALHAGAGFGADSAAAVLSVGARCDGHSATGDAARTGAARRPTLGVDLAGSLKTGPKQGWRIDTEEAADGRLVAGPIFNATAKFGEFVEDDTAGNLSARDYKSSNHLIGAPPDPGGVRAPDGLAGRLDDSADVEAVMLPLGLDSHRYRCCGNGVVSNVSEWIGVRLAEAVA
jgi:hypothetical protein